jgi:hypothetical protein
MPLFKSLFKKKDKKSPGNASIEPSSSNTANTGDAAQQEASTTVASLASKNPASDIPTEAYGLFPLHTEVKGEVIIPQPDPDDEEIDIYPIDIVALHGITGGAFHTWTHDNGTFWLQDFLTVDFPGARVFSYGYDADVFFTLNTGGLDEFSRTLLEHLKQRRTGKVRPSALITFVRM